MTFQKDLETFKMAQVTIQMAQVIIQMAQMTYWIALVSGLPDDPISFLDGPCGL